MKEKEGKVQGGVDGSREWVYLARQERSEKKRIKRYRTESKIGLVGQAQGNVGYEANEAVVGSDRSEVT